MKSTVVYPAKVSNAVCKGGALRHLYETGGTIPKLGKSTCRTGGLSFSFQKVRDIYALFANQHKLKSVAEMPVFALYKYNYVK
jgi:hypothetical protein